ncbi:alpha/beta hydrolase [Nocardioides bizhenqiangii]|uniref:Alpha/beta hydrolase n=1 Tax=Nocardioides bizhenqiangii TaxID=3095076 RepID=A0ABZ0ZQD1_9ACTN|nr:alpha/beta hydrolase [Nocardioides sp. HM61]WQQ26059.1 alpha/beta hydrolase [Nocardioides sp. HM61]
MDAAGGPRRRTVLAAAVALTAAACGNEQEKARPTTGGDVGTDYGEDPSQFGELLVPDGEPRGVVVVIHGGFWKAAYDLSLGTPLAQDLTGRGWVTWNLEYRRVGNGGGVPATLDDVAAGIDHLASLADDGLLPEDSLDRVVTLGHSAGGHLATWAAGREAPRVPVTHVVSQAGVLDLVAAARDGLGGGAVEAFLGHAPGPADAAADPAQQLPLDVPVWCVHAPDDDIVPISQSRGYVDRATAAGATAELVEVTGGHFGVIEVGSQAWVRIRSVIDGLR